jgi:hypothetical protein
MVVVVDELVVAGTVVGVEAGDEAGDDGTPRPDSAGAVDVAAATVVVVASGTVVVDSRTVVVVDVVVVVVVVGAVGVSASDTSDGAPSPRADRARIRNSCSTSLSRSVTVYDVAVDTPSSSCCHAPESTDISRT